MPPANKLVTLPGMKAVSLILIFVGILLGLLAASSFGLDYQYEKASVSSEATISSMRIEPIRDGVIDTTEHKVTEQFTNNTPLPTIEQFQSNTFYNRALFGQMLIFVLFSFMVRAFFTTSPV